MLNKADEGLYGFGVRTMVATRQAATCDIARHSDVDISVDTHAGWFSMKMDLK